MPIDFTPTAEQCDLRRSARRFAQQVLSEVAPATHHLHTPEARFSATRPMYAQLIEAGFLRRIIPKPFGGEGAGMLDMAIVAEEFYAVDVNVPLTMFATLLGLFPLVLAGTPEQHERYFAPFLARKGAPLAALANSEPGGSANFSSPAPGAGVRTTARMEGDEWVINGTKKWVSSATGWDNKGADLLCVVCRTDPQADPDHAISILAVAKPGEGIVPDGCTESMGHRAHYTPQFRLDNVRVPKDSVIGTVGGGKDLVEASFSGTAALVGIMSVGVMRGAFDFALHFARTEKRAGVANIIEHQAVGYALADAKMAIEACRALSLRACSAIDAGAPGALELALHAKVFCSEMAVRVITDLMRVVGIDSYDHALPLAGMLQDALAFPLFDGGNMGVRRRQLHDLMRSPDYDSLSASGSR
ncbi:acyl-CoA dehydrogenase family protein [Cupriavidus sp. 2TAF22]|uniref:acyl-CoA dehydrogenase family protein n=1 Tax=unclassified Cupriavidus TaxID=2640874 RepID=UPI003F93715E